MAVWIESESPISHKAKDTGSGYDFTFSSAEDEAPVVLSGGPQTVQGLEQVPGNSFCSPVATEGF